MGATASSPRPRLPAGDSESDGNDSDGSLSSDVSEETKARRKAEKATPGEDGAAGRGMAAVRFGKDWRAKFNRRKSSDNAARQGAASQKAANPFAGLAFAPAAAGPAPAPAAGDVVEGEAPKPSASNFFSTLSMKGKWRGIVKSKDLPLPDVPGRARRIAGRGSQDLGSAALTELRDKLGVGLGRRGSRASKDDAAPGPAPGPALKKPFMPDDLTDDDEPEGDGGAEEAKADLWKSSMF